MTAHLPRFCVSIEQGDALRKEVVSGEDRVVIGRSPEADLVIDDAGVSPLHCEIARDEQGFVLRDLGSEQGTWLSGVRVREVVLPAEAHFELGGCAVSFGCMKEGESVPAQLTEPRGHAVDEPSRPEPSVRVSVGPAPDATGEPVDVGVPFKIAKAKIVSAFEHEYLTAILAKNKGNITAAANAAQLDRVHFLRLLDRYGLRKTKVTSRPPKNG